MRKDIIYEAQQYLTIEKDDGLKRIINIEDLLRRHSVKKVVGFLKLYLREKEKELQNLIRTVKTEKRIDELIAAIFRMHMAIETLENGKEVIAFERSQQRAEESGRFHKRNRRRNNRSRSRKNRGNDAKDRTTGYPTQRAA
jgi:hypothetical protein